MKELRTFKLRKKSLVNKDILEKENAKQKRDKDSILFVSQGKNTRMVLSFAPVL